ncbi:uncharacterized protein LOC107053500 isoform X2 [Gallus gallus]|uniref:uncharacterized protein LOC107053500 isoform X2 n=1 Tax=Gallus gallus TaxID=9031 RepID=UPI001F01DCE7|nr:uncharacterized protein LOC107053500 isoform X2 [Gallus gallus]
MRRIRRQGFGGSEGRICCFRGTGPEKLSTELYTSNDSTNRCEPGTRLNPIRPGFLKAAKRCLRRPRAAFRAAAIINLGVAIPDPREKEMIDAARTPFPYAAPSSARRRTVHQCKHSCKLSKITETLSGALSKTNKPTSVEAALLLCAKYLKKAWTQGDSTDVNTAHWIKHVDPGTSGQDRAHMTNASDFFLNRTWKAIAEQTECYTTVAINCES